jgi:hypothetical protein
LEVMEKQCYTSPKPLTRGLFFISLSEDGSACDLGL